jgi:hypothetical protein
LAELEEGHPDELVKVLENWLCQAESPTGTLLPEGIGKTEWAIRQFINYWKGVARQAIESVEADLGQALQLCQTSAPHSQIASQLEAARQTLQEDLRDHLGLYEWNKS